MTRLFAALCVAAGLALGACQKAEPPRNAKSTPSAAASTAAPIPGRYKATLAEGIQFADKPDYPNFIRSAFGMSGHEPGGRWSDGPKVVFTFTESLPRNFTLKLDMNGAFGPNVGQPIQVRAGSWQGQFTLDAKPSSVELRVSSSTPPDAIEFTIPSPISPKELGISPDPRKVGVSFQRLSVL